MSARPPIIISTMDLHRLEKLFEDQAANSFAGMAELEAELVRAQLVEPAAIPADVVSMNSSVRFSVDGQEYVRTLVYPAALNDTDQQISVMAPVGSAMLGMREGSSIGWPRHGGGSMNVTIERIISQPEREGQFHR